MYYKKRKIKKKAIVALAIFLLLIALIITIIKLYSHYTSNEYKLSKIGYNEKEISTLLKADSKVLTKALDNKYDEHLIPLTNEKYFLWKNYKTYKQYITELTKETTDIDYQDVVTKVNVKRNYDYYTHTKKTDMDQNEAILVNKYYALPDKYAPEDIVDVSNWYAFEGIKTRQIVYDAFKEMFNAAKEDGITLIINSGYRTYEAQSKVYEEYKEAYGEEYADNYAARPDYSEHQSGLALDIITYGASGETFETTEAFKWLQDNADKYGFILRYPKDKEDITGYKYESWHYRYLGKELAKKVKKSGLTYDEYYAYYLDKD